MCNSPSLKQIVVVLVLAFIAILVFGVLNNYATQRVVKEMSEDIVYESISK